MQRRFFFSLFILASGLVSAASPKIAPDLAQVDPEAWNVQYKHAPGPANHGRVISAGGSLKQKFNSLNGAAYGLKIKSLKALADDEVLYISPNRAVHGNAATVTYDYMAQTVGAYNLSASSGSGIGVAVIDSGIAASLDLNNASGRTRVVYNESFVPGTSDAKDHYGHGTPVAGIIAGNGYHSSGSCYYHEIKGIAPGASLINLRVLDKNGTATDSQVIQVIDRAIALKSKYNIRVINLSLEHACV